MSIRIKTKYLTTWQVMNDENVNDEQNVLNIWIKDNGSIIVDCECSCKRIKTAWKHIKNAILESNLDDKIKDDLISWEYYIVDEQAYKDDEIGATVSVDTFDNGTYICIALSAERVRVIMNGYETKVLNEIGYFPISSCACLIVNVIDDVNDTITVTYRYTSHISNPTTHKLYWNTKGTYFIKFGHIYYLNDCIKF